jgi:hypothetical protein
MVIGPIDDPLEHPEKNNDQAHRQERDQKKRRPATGRGSSIGQENEEDAKQADQPQARPNKPVFGLCGVLSKIDWSLQHECAPSAKL